MFEVYFCIVGVFCNIIYYFECVYRTLCDFLYIWTYFKKSTCLEHAQKRELFPYEMICLTTFLKHIYYNLYIYIHIYISIYNKIIYIYIYNKYSINEIIYSKRKRASSRALGFIYRRAASWCRFLVRRFVVFVVSSFVVSSLYRVFYMSSWRSLVRRFGVLSFRRFVVSSFVVSS